MRQAQALTMWRLTVAALTAAVAVVAVAVEVRSHESSASVVRVHETQEAREAHAGAFRSPAKCTVSKGTFAIIVQVIPSSSPLASVSLLPKAKMRNRCTGIVSLVIRRIIIFVEKEFVF